MFGSLQDGTYIVRVNPPTDSPLGTATVGPFSVADGGGVHAAVAVLRPPVRFPPGITATGSITGHHPVEVAWVQTIFWLESTFVDFGNDIWGAPCVGGHGTWTLVIPVDDGWTFTGLLNYTISGPIVDTGGGHYSFTIPPLHPHHGTAIITWSLDCPGKPHKSGTWDAYIDPSGIVQDVDGTLLPGATVTLFRSAVESGPLTQVPDGDAIMSPSNRNNPDLTNAVGYFRWDVLAGFYVVRAAAPGCSAPSDPAQPFVETAVLSIPPPVTDLVLTLQCKVREVATDLSVRYDRTHVRGRVRTRADCRADRTVSLMRPRKGRDDVIGTDTTSARGRWAVLAGESHSAYYARVAGSRRTSTETGRQLNCLRDRSRKIVRREARTSGR